MLQLCGEGALAQFAVGGAVEQSFHDLKVPVVNAEYLCAIALQTGRPKDYQRVYSMLEAKCVNTDNLKSLIAQHHLTERWNTYARRFA